ncbi:UBA-like domain-containing protein 2-B [Watersipora subatra]|uniref:UBA-like domain-containing protein 2-B n=1 Tax=Watersipora subatra TaxID=2589382 RepID=UPI00355C00F2
MDSLREQLVLNQFMMISGCPEDQARKYLQASQWQYETALSFFFQESAVTIPNRCRNCGGTHNHLTVCAPTNTPATPPQFPDALAAFNKLSATDSTRYGSTPLSNSNTPQTHTMQHVAQHQQPPNFFAAPTQQVVSQNPKHIEVGK